MNPYKILELDNTTNITKTDIRNAYKKLILKYHPDKNIDIDTTEKFKEIHAAYELLYNEESKKKYDNLNNNEKYDYFTNFKNLFNNKYPTINELLNLFIESFYNNDENQFKNDINDKNYESIYYNIINKLPDFLADKLSYPIRKKIYSNILKPNINITGTINCTLLDKYLNKYNILKINRETREIININVPLLLDNYILENEGETINNINGDIIIDIKTENNNIFSKINNDLYCYLDISLYLYLYGGEYEFKNIDNTIIKLNLPSLLNNNKYIINNKGFLINEKSNIRGNLIIIFSIKDLDSIKNIIYNLNI